MQLTQCAQGGELGSQSEWKNSRSRTRVSARSRGIKQLCESGPPQLFAAAVGSPLQLRFDGRPGSSTWQTASGRARGAVRRRAEDPSACLPPPLPLPHPRLGCPHQRPWCLLQLRVGGVLAEEKRHMAQGATWGRGGGFLQTQTELPFLKEGTAWEEGGEIPGGPLSALI